MADELLKLIDTHTHPTMKDYAGDLTEVLARSRQAGVERWVAIGTSLEDSAAGIELAREHSGLYCSAGIHPHNAQHQKSGYLNELQKLAGADNVKAIGEIGLDYYYEFSKKDTQKKIFAEQLELADKLGLPIIIHCREALDDCLSMLDNRQHSDTPVVFHCFSGNVEQARLILDRGFFISFTGIITFKNATEAQRAAEYVPLEMVMLETDCPYLSPEPARNVRPNEPALLIHIAEKLAQLKNIPVTEIARATTKNSCLFFGIDV
jgi:TatD DNase family protein